RRKMYRFVADHPELFDAPAAHDVAVLYSSPSRDASCMIDRPSRDAQGRDVPAIGLYPSVPREGDEEWWSDQTNDAATLLNYLGDYRGVCKMLIDAHVPFDIVTAPHASSDVLAKYR